MSRDLEADGRAAALARYYDLDVMDISYDAELYQQLAQEAGGPVLELGVGSGRLGIPLALAGHKVLGIDDDEAMLARARDTWQAVRGGIELDRFSAIEADFMTFRSPQSFGLSFIAVNTFLLLEDDASRLTLLETMRRHLRLGGIAAVEIDIPDEQELASYDGRLHLEWLRSDPESGDQVTKVICARYDSEAGTMELTQVYESTSAHGGVVRRVAKTDTLHLIRPEQLLALARQAGFAEVQLKGDHLPTPYGAGSHRAILVARLV
ncbi:MAG: trans-aconitate 2-methyltransferase [Chloroflexota bacterium]